MRQQKAAIDLERRRTDRHQVMAKRRDDNTMAGLMLLDNANYREPRRDIRDERLPA